MNTVRLPDGSVPAIYFVDLDGTLLSTSSEKVFLKHLVRNGILSPKAFLGFLLRYFLHPLRTVREGKGWNRSYLRGISPEEIRREAFSCAKSLLTSRMRDWTLQSIRELSESGCRIVLLSASLEYIVTAIAEIIPVDEIVASTPEIIGNRFTGDLKKTRPWGRNKIELAMNICKRSNTEPARCAAAGDSWADRFIMKESGCSVAVCPDRRLKKLARKKNWRIVKGSHTKWA